MAEGAPKATLANQAVVIQPVIYRELPKSHELPWVVVWSLPLLPLILTMIGWVVVGRQTDRRERRKDIRESISEVRKRVGVIELRSGEYVQTKPNDGKAAVLAGQIKADLQAVPLMITALQKAGLPFARWDLVAALRQEATGGDFDTKSRKVGDAQRPALVSSAANDLLTELDTAYFRAFPISMKAKARTNTAKTV